MTTITIKESITDAISYWERGRILYNIALLIVVVGTFVFYWPHSRQTLSVDIFQGLFVLAVLSNVAYCAAYPVDLIAQSSAHREVWLRIRWVLLAVGITFACVIAQFFSRGLFSVSPT